ncbi:hypothetical protein AAE02nite_27090 [Adhaeribacter aerolatus]|uniref:DUF2249 domain-containing protein n=1 Tax=Adhaeribacter aerolatus TaxID=670289 RepID=A0A512AZA7_9BACT|nr:DUF2249 domain-containing protein [Adhaeribacter aerolatus]GEO05045.1 hypothetical protein AAE02nite_27090 [Adhaeribacter aerolatus]
MSQLTPPLKINAETRISTLIRANPATIEAIASINKHFEKLRNPLLRKVLASRVTIADAARIGGTSVEVFFEKLKALGFVSERAGAVTPNPVTAPLPDLPPVGLTLDVREGLQQGLDPFKEIMAAAENLPAGKSLLIINTFEPIPLYAILRKKGFTHYTCQSADNLVHTYFYQAGPAVAPDKPLPNAEKPFKNLYRQYQHNLVELDVRNLEMPLPMMTILEAVHKLLAGQALLVYHCRVPQYLLPQLAENGFGWAVANPSPGEVRLLIYKLPGHELTNR